MKKLILTGMYTLFCSFLTAYPIMIENLKIKDSNNFKWNNFNGFIAEINSLSLVALNIEGNFKVTKFLSKDSFKTAEDMARIIWKKLLPNVRVEAPFPCGKKLLGTINVNNKAKECTIKGFGNGSHDTCSNTGGPGSWSYELIVEWSRKQNFGSLYLNGFSE